LINTKGQGSAKSLTGLIYPLIIFVSEVGHPWTSLQKQQILRLRGEAEHWICDQSRIYNSHLAFHRGGNFGYENDIVVDFIPQATGSNDEYSHWVAYLLQKIGWDPLDLNSKLIKESGSTHLHVEMYANKAGRSYAIPFCQGADNQKYFMEGAFIYRFYQNSSELLSASIAHEILHLYGAWDLYHNCDVTKDQTMHALRLFPNDIMVRIDTSIDKLSISPLTAWRIGWTEFKEDWYDFFDPHR